MQKLQYLTLSRKRYEIEHRFHEGEGAAEVSLGVNIWETRDPCGQHAPPACSGTPFTRQTDRETDRHTNEQTNEQTDKPVDIAFA